MLTISYDKCGEDIQSQTRFIKNNLGGLVGVRSGFDFRGGTNGLHDLQIPANGIRRIRVLTRLDTVSIKFMNFS